MISTRKIVSLVLLGSVLGGCSLTRRLGIKDEVPGHKEPKTTSIYGDWVLASPDSTAFAGASQVELRLQPASFTITATYPGQSSPEVVSGTAMTDSTGLLTLTPTSGSARRSSGSLAFETGRPVSLIASAAGSTLLFKPPTQDANPTPSSVWHKRSLAVEAGKISKDKTTTSGGQVVPPDAR